MDELTPGAAGPSPSCARTPHGVHSSYPNLTMVVHCTPLAKKVPLQLLYDSSGVSEAEEYELLTNLSRKKKKSSRISKLDERRYIFIDSSIVVQFSSVQSRHPLDTVWVYCTIEEKRKKRGALIAFFFSF